MLFRSVGSKETARTIEFDKAAERWPWICPNPVPRDDYKAAFETGTWPDGTPTVAHDAATPAKSNLPSDPFERLKAELDDKMASAKAWLAEHPTAKTQVEADRARNLQAEILALNKQADAMHKAEKAPIIAAGDAVEAKFGFRKIAKGFADSLRVVFERFAVAEEARLKREAQEKHAVALKAAEIARQEVEKQRAKQFFDDPIAALTSPEPELPELPKAPEPVKVNVGGGVGRAAGLKSVWSGTIDDIDAVFAHFKDTDQVRECLQKLVDATVRTHKGSTKLPGVTVSEQRKAA
mgnify:FL=1